MAPTYHLELRRFPKVSNRFNLTGQEVGAIVIPWVQERVIEIDGENWAPYDASITIIEGPPIPVERLSMGRGWRIAEREGENVTDRVMGEARSAVGGAATAAPASATPAVDYPSAAKAGAASGAPADHPSSATDGAEADRRSPAIAGTGEEPASTPVAEPEPELAALLGADGERLLSAWAAVASRTDGLAPSESLALAERELRRENSPG